MNKPTCPRCHSKSLRPRFKKQECVCMGCGFRMPSPWDRPDEYKKLVKSMTPPSLKVVHHLDMGDGREEEIEQEGIYQP